MGIIRPSIGDFFDEHIEALKSDIRLRDRNSIVNRRTSTYSELEKAYLVPEIITGDPIKEVSEDSRTIKIRFPVKDNPYLLDFLQRETRGVGSWIDLAYKGKELVYEMPAPLPEKAKEIVNANIVKIKAEEIDERNEAIRSGNERVSKELKQAFEKRYNELKAEDERRANLENELK